jgi:hypothetical protein
MFDNIEAGLRLTSSDVATGGQQRRRSDLRQDHDAEQRFEETGLHRPGVWPLRAELT